MEPFSITCDTCAAKLKVRRATAIGQRLACPKCGSMLKVLPPENWTPPADLDPKIRRLIDNARQPTESFDFDDMDAIIAQAGSAPPKPVEKPQSPPDSPARLAPEDAVKAVRQRSNMPIKKRSKSTSASDSDSPLLPNAQWTSDAEKKKRKILTIVAIALSGLLVLTAVTTAVVVNWPQDQQANQIEARDGNEESDQAAEEQDDVGEKKAEKNDSDTNDAKSNDDSSTSSTDPEQSERQANDAVDQSTADEDANKETEAGNSITPTIGDPPEIGPAGNPPQIADNGTSEKPNTPLLPDNPMLPGNKPDLNVGANQTEGALSAASLLDSIVGQTPELDGFEAIFESSGASFAELEDIADSNARIELGTPKYFIEKKAPGSINLQRVLDSKIKNIRYTDFQLVYVLNVLSRFGLAWDFDSVGLASIDFDFNQKITVDLEDVTLREIIDSIAKQLDLATEYTSEPYPLVTFTSQLANKATEQEYPLPFKDADALEGFVKMIPQLIAPGAWPQKIDEAIQIKGSGIAVKTTPRIHRQIADLSKSMMAVATYNDNPDDPVANENLIPFPVKVQKLVEQQLNLEPQLRLPLWAFLEQIHEQTGVLVLVDWTEAIKLGWTPETTVPGNILEPDLESLLQQLCHSLDMSWAILDEQTIELTSHGEAESRTFVAAYPFKMILNDKITPTDIKTFVFGTVLGKQIQRPNVRIMDQVEYLCFVAVTPQSLHQKIAPVMAKLRGTSR